MEFQRASDRLNYFFSPHRWALLVDATNIDAITPHLQAIQTACNHWGSKLEFPLQLNPQAFENTYEANEFWLQKMPGLRLLHARKQQILISELFQGYSPDRANELLRRKLNLNQLAWAHLLYFSNNNRTYVCTFPQRPQPIELRKAIAQFHQEHIDEQIDRQETQNAVPSNFADQHGLNDIQTPMAQLMMDATTDNNIAQVNRIALREPDRIRINHYNASIHFLDMQVTIKLSPQCFAIYCLYIDEVEGFTNKDRRPFQAIAEQHYRRLLGSDDLRPIVNCFDMNDDKPLRDVVYKIKRDFEHHLGSTELARPYIINGRPGGIKRIAIQRDKVSYGDGDTP